MKETVVHFMEGEEGQDLVEYSLLLAFVCLIAAGVFVQVGTTLGNFWALENSKLSSLSATAVS